MNSTFFAPLRLLLALSAIGAATVACQSQTPPSTTVTGSDLNNATGVPVSSLPNEAASTGGNVPLDNAAAGQGNAALTPNAVLAVGPMVVSPHAATPGSPKCLAAQSSPPADGTPVVLADCSDEATQHWVSQNGRLSTQGNMCLSNDGAVGVGAPSITQLAAVLHPCNPNAGELRQHVESRYGAVAVVTGAATWALTVVDGGATQNMLYWAGYNGNDVTQGFTLGATAGNANVTATAPRGIAVRITGSNNCLEAATAAASTAGGAVTLAPCDAGSAAQAWQVDVYGQLSNAGRCLDHTGGTLTLPTCSQAVPSRTWSVNYGWLIGPTTCLTAAAGSGALSLQPCGATSSRWTLGQAG